MCSPGRNPHHPRPNTFECCRATVRHGRFGQDTHLTKNKFGSVIVLVLLVTVGLLTTGVAHKMPKTAVASQAIERPPAATTVSDSSSAEAPLAVFIGDFTGGSDVGGVGDKNWTSILSADIQKTMPLRPVVDSDVGGDSGYVVRGTVPHFPSKCGGS